MVKISLSVLLATVGLLPASSLLCPAIAQMNYNPMYTPDFTMSNSAQRALEIRLESMRRSKSSSSSSSGMNRSKNTTSSQKQVITAKQYQYIVKRMQQRMPGRDAEVRQILNRTVEVRN
jgi:hypothetical protein